MIFKLTYKVVCFHKCFNTALACVISCPLSHFPYPLPRSSPWPLTSNNPPSVFTAHVFYYPLTPLKSLITPYLHRQPPPPPTALWGPFLLPDLYGHSYLISILKVRWSIFLFLIVVFGFTFFFFSPFSTFSMASYSSFFFLLRHHLSHYLAQNGLEL